MPKFKVGVVPPGTHHPATGPFTATRARSKHWADTFRRMKAAGIKVPLAWGHQPKAEPADEAKTQADKEYWLSKYNAGYVDDAMVEPDGTLSIIADAPGVTVENGAAVTTAKMPDGSTVKCSISEVSGAFRDWTSGAGVHYPDSMIHVALTPLPVVADQAGFIPLSNSAPITGEIRLSLATLISHEGVRMADDLNLEGEDDGGKGGEDDGGESAGGDGKKKSDDGGAIDSSVEDADDSELITEASAEMEELGIHIPDDLSSCQEWVRHLITAIKTHKSTKSMAEGEGAAAGAVAGEQAAGAAQATPPSTESPPMMMSLTDLKDPIQKTMFNRIAKTESEKRAARITQLARRRWSDGTPCVPPGEIDDLRKMAGGVLLSLTPDGDPVETEVDRILSRLERMLPSVLLSTRFDGAKPAPSPMDAEAEQAGPDPREWAKKSGLRVREVAANSNGTK